MNDPFFLGLALGALIVAVPSCLILMSEVNRMKEATNRLNEKTAELSAKTAQMIQKYGL